MPMLGETKLIGGKLHEFNGKGWVPVSSDGTTPPKIFTGVPVREDSPIVDKSQGYPRWAITQYDANGTSRVIYNPMTASEANYYLYGTDPNPFNAPAGPAYTPPVSIVSIVPAGYGKVIVTYSDGSQETQTDQGQTGAGASPVLPPADFIPSTTVPGSYFNPYTGATYDPSKTGGTSPVLPPADFIPSTTVPGTFFNPYTGAAYDPKAANPYLSTSVPTGYVAIKDTAGNIIRYDPDPTYKTPSTYLQGAVPSGYIAIKDTAGNIIRYDPDPNFISAYDQAQLARYDAETKARIAETNARIQAIKAQEAGADRRQAAALAAERANLQMRLRNDMAIASMDNKSRLQMANLDAAITGRGQTASYMAATRGQDVTRELGLRDLAQRTIQTGAEMSGRDLARSALYFLGETGGQTPYEGAFSMLQKLTPEIKPVGPAPGLPAMPAPLKFQGGGQVIRSNSPVPAIVGERGPELALLPPGGAVQPMNAPTGAPAPVLDAAAQAAMPALLARQGGSPAGGLAEQNRQAASDILGRTVVMEEFTVKDIDPEQPGAGLRLVEAIRGRSSRRALRPDLIETPIRAQGGVAVNPYSRGEGSIRQRLKTPRKASVPVTHPDEDFPTVPGTSIPPALMPSDLSIPSFLGSSAFPTTEADLQKMRDTVANILSKTFYGDVQPVGAGLPPMEPLFGVQLADPTQMASRFSGLPYDLRNAMLSAWGTRSISAPAAYERMRSVTPEAMPNYGPIRWGARGLVVRPAAHWGM